MKPEDDRVRFFLACLAVFFLLALVRYLLFSPR